VTSWVARLFGCTTVIHSRGDERWCAFKGQVHNVELAQSWFKYLWDSCKKANTEHARSESRGTFNERETARAVFRLHFCVAVANRLKEKYNAMRTQSGVVSGSTALVVAAWFDAERKEVELWLKEKHPDMLHTRLRGGPFGEPRTQDHTGGGLANGEFTDGSPSGSVVFRPVGGRHPTGYIFYQFPHRLAVGRVLASGVQRCGLQGHRPSVRG
jgi:hypothetical protein